MKSLAIWAGVIAIVFLPSMALSQSEKILPPPNNNNIVPETAVTYGSKGADPVPVDMGHPLPSLCMTYNAGVLVYCPANAPSGGAAGDPSSTYTIGAVAGPSRASLSAIYDGTNIRPLLGDTAGRQIVVVYSLPAITGTVGITGLLPGFATPPTMAATQAGPWTFAVNNFPAAQPVTGTFWQPTQPVSVSSLPLAPGAATATAQATNTAAITAAQAAPGSAAGTANAVQGVPGGLAIDTVVKATTADRGASVSTTASTLMAANAARRGFAIQNQSSGACYINGTTTATQDYHSLLIGAGAYYETPQTHTGTGPISIICSAAGAAVYAREW